MNGPPSLPGERQIWIKGRRRKRKQAREARVRRQLLRYVLLALMTVCGMSVFTLIPWSFAGAQQDIVVHGNRVAAEEQIRRQLAPFAGRAIYSLDPAKIAASVEHLAVVKHAFVRRELSPRPRLVVDVLEEFPWATVIYEPGGAAQSVVSESGRFIPISEFPSVIQPGLVLCVNSDTKLRAHDVSDWDMWVRLIEGQCDEKVTLIDLRRPTDIRVQAGELDLRVGAADSTMTRRLSRIVSVLPVVRQHDNQVVYVDLSLDTNIPLRIDKSRPLHAEPKPVHVETVSTPVTRSADTALGEPPADVEVVSEPDIRM